jgi:hypothetical protein
MFAADTKVFKAIQSPNDAVKLQEDITNLGIWSSESGLQFNETKCKAQSITRKTNPIPTTYFTNDAPLASIKHGRDLGVWISSDLTLNKHVNEQCAQANKMLSYIRRKYGTHEQLTALLNKKNHLLVTGTITSWSRDASLDTSIYRTSAQTRKTSDVQQNTFLIFHLSVQ